MARHKGIFLMELITVIKINKKEKRLSPKNRQSWNI